MCYLILQVGAFIQYLKTLDSEAAFNAENPGQNACYYISKFPAMFYISNTEIQCFWRTEICKALGRGEEIKDKGHRARTH